MTEGQKVSFKMYDDLFKDYIHGTGVLLWNIGKLWRIAPGANPRLSGGDIQLHENSILKVA